MNINNWQYKLYSGQPETVFQFNQATHLSPSIFLVTVDQFKEKVLSQIALAGYIAYNKPGKHKTPIQSSVHTVVRKMSPTLQ